jgi:hypothetical protein
MDTPLIDDDHIISLLRKDAEASRFGSSLTATRRDKNAPKPNTRFLKNLVKNADSHNAALLAKEKAETRARLSALESGAKRGREDAGDERDDGGGKRKRRDGEREGRWKGILSGLGKQNTRERDGDVRREKRRNSPDARSRPQAQKDDDRSAGKKHEEHSNHSNHSRRRSRSPDSRSRSPRHHHALVIAKANHIAPGVQHTGIDKTTESDIPELLKTTTTTKSKSLSRNLQNLPPPTTTNPPTHQTPTPTTP